MHAAGHNPPRGLPRPVANLCVCGQRSAYGDEVTECAASIKGSEPQRYISPTYKIT